MALSLLLIPSGLMEMSKSKSYPGVSSSISSLDEELARERRLVAVGGSVVLYSLLTGRPLPPNRSSNSDTPLEIHTVSELTIAHISAIGVICSDKIRFVEPSHDIRVLEVKLSIIFVIFV